MTPIMTKWLTVTKIRGKGSNKMRKKVIKVRNLSSQVTQMVIASNFNHYVARIVKKNSKILTFESRCVQSGKTVENCPLAAPQVGFRSCFCAVPGKCHRLYGVKLTQSRREAATITT